MSTEASPPLPGVIAEELGDSVAYRPMWGGDVPFVYSSWLKSFRHAYRKSPPRFYYAYYHPLITKLLARGDTTVCMACDGADQGFIVGWVCATRLPSGGTVLHWVYVKRTYRQLGLATALCAQAGIRADTSIGYTFKGRLADKLEPKVRAAAYVPIEEFLA